MGCVKKNITVPYEMFFPTSFLQNEHIGDGPFFYLLWRFSPFVMTSVECQRLVHKQRLVPGHTEKNLCGHQAIDIRRPDVQRNPSLGEEPQQPHPSMLPKQMLINITQRHKHGLHWYLRIRQNVGMHGEHVKEETKPS